MTFQDVLNILGAKDLEKQALDDVNKSVLQSLAPFLVLGLLILLLIWSK
jgi:hypothetical protein